MAFSAPFRSMATTARKSLKIGMIPADGIGREVLPVCLQFPLFLLFPYLLKGAKAAIQALGSSIPTTEFIDLLAGFECFQRTGTALPDETVEVLKNECDCALFGAVRYVVFQKKFSVQLYRRQTSQLALAQSCRLFITYCSFTQENGPVC